MLFRYLPLLLCCLLCCVFDGTESKACSSRNTLCIILGSTPMIFLGMWEMSVRNYSIIPKFLAEDGDNEMMEKIVEHAHVHNYLSHGEITSNISHPITHLPKTDFSSEVAKRTNKDGLIIVPAVIDHGYFDMAHNFFLSSIRRLGLTNMTLFVCVDKAACNQAQEHGLPSYLYRETSHQNSGDFNSGAFVEKAMMKHFVVYDILLMGHSVLLTDLDMYWFKSPIRDIVAKCGKDCDFIIQNEAKVELNIGFMLVHPTRRSLALYKNLILRAKTKSSGGAQSLFNALVRQNKAHLKYKVLDINKYPDGQTYFEGAKRIFPEEHPCTQCYICHNNWIVGTEGKRFRFREHKMWVIDQDAYYSSPSRKYLVYDNIIPRMYTMDICQEEKEALRAAMAIATALNRTLILPRYFHNAKFQRVPLHGVAIIRDFDSVFENTYRESTFLQNGLVPSSILTTDCGTFLIANNFTDARPGQFNYTDITKTFHVSDKEHGATDQEVLRWFGGELKDCSVLRFHSMYRAFSRFLDKSQQAEFTSNFNRGFSKGEYRQLELLGRKN